MWRCKCLDENKIYIGLETEPDVCPGCGSINIVTEEEL